VRRSIHLVVELSTATTTDGIQVLVALNGSALNRLYRTWATLAVPLGTWTATTWWRGQTTAVSGGTVATITRLSVVRSSAVAEAMSASSHGSGTVVVSSIGIPVTTHSRVECASHVHAVLHPIACGHVHVGQVKASWCSGRLDMVTHWEVAVTVRIAAGRGDVRRVDDITVDKSELYLD
jgi:hypothetical protein